MNKIYYMVSVTAVCTMTLCGIAYAGAVDFPGESPGKANAEVRAENTFQLSNNVLSASWKMEGKTLLSEGITNKKMPQSGNTEGSPSSNLFLLSTQEDSFNLPSGKFVLQGKPVISSLKGTGQKTSGSGNSFPGKSISATFKETESGMTVRWKAELRDGSAYVREIFDVEASQPVELKKIQLTELKGPYKVLGNVPGSPLVGDNGVYAGVELPVAKAQAEGDAAHIGFDCKLPMTAGVVNTFSTVKGVWAKDQLRRSFLHYLERERATPYHQYLHYNGWYDTGLNPSAKHLIETAAVYGKELGKRKVKLEGFVLDDGWDDVNEGLWLPSTKKFPGGFSDTIAAVKKIPSKFGIWISPLGGYYGTDERIAQAKKLGALPQDAKEFDLSYPEYRKWFKERCASLMTEDGVNYFKWDKAGHGVSPHFMNLLGIANELKKIDPSVFINVTVGTWPSPFWLNHIDCTWRDGTADVFWTGKGNTRERSITFRDGACYGYIVICGPLYPLNSLMHHGIVLGNDFQGKNVTFGEKGGENNFDLKNDARMFFGAGANLQELYLTASMMDEKAWNDVAEAAKWARKNSDILVDIHWTAGNPNKLEPYGYAAWTRAGATLALRNPDDQPREVELDAKEVFQPEPGSPAVFKMKSPYKDQRLKSLDMEQGKKVKITMEPFEVLVFEMRSKAVK